MVLWILTEPTDWEVTKIDVFIMSGYINMFVKCLSILLSSQVIKTVNHAFYNAYNMKHDSIIYMKLGATTLKLMLTENSISAIPFCSTTLLMNYMI